MTKFNKDHPFKVFHVDPEITDQVGGQSSNPASFIHRVKHTRCPYWGIIVIDMSPLAFFNPEP